MKARIQIWMNREQFLALKQLLEDGTSGSEERRLREMQAYNEDSDYDGPMGYLVEALEKAHDNDSNYEPEESL